ncbi:hypothetical protein EVAR_52763_1 [Eumeta japonica]|uniref:Uncharacterized protein n=1 Tax=Eumeta variegata TaxID=151549 RepID=A0A4C1XFN8_EUMVA|nr:hypothetical protein EVAR_52763_1 [Eumeta japonica]
MYNRYLIVGVLLHCSAVFWCGAMHLPIDRGSRVRFPDNEIASDVKNDIRNIIHTGEPQLAFLGAMQLLTPLIFLKSKCSAKRY